MQSELKKEMVLESLTNVFKTKADIIGLTETHLNKRFLLKKSTTL